MNLSVTVNRRGRDCSRYKMSQLQRTKEMLLRILNISSNCWTDRTALSSNKSLNMLKIKIVTETVVKEECEHLNNNH